MPDNVEIQKFTATLEGGGIPIESAVVSHSVDKFPQANVMGHFVADGGLEETTVSTPLTTSVMSKIAELQRNRFESRTTPDFKLVINSGRTDLKFNGFLSAPMTELYRGGIHNKLAAVQEAALLDALNISIYARRVVSIVEKKNSPGDKSKQQSNPTEDEEARSAAASGDIIKLILRCTDLLWENYESALAEASDNDKVLLSNQHAINEAPRKIWIGILLDSQVDFKSIKSAIAADKAVATQLISTTWDILKNPVSGFWNTIRHLMSTFHMTYVPSLSGNGNGKFIRADTRVAEPEGALTVSIDSINLVDGSRNILPLGGVVMRHSLIPSSNERNNKSSPILASYPKPLKSGFIHQEPTPRWLTIKDSQAIMGSEVDSSELSDDPPLILSLARYVADKSKVAKFLLKSAGLGNSIMDEICEVAYKELRLGSSTGVITEPLDLSRTDALGKRMTINIAGGDSSFVAFISNVTHRISLQNGKKLSSSTQLELSHVEYT